ncbi:dihydroxyacetone kinase [Trichoderma guizhouense]|uniref:Dihydroxyacetone kinase n=1 Tax=Trichoderma guizhouense TaxID=1491466 RepID=A0A1T3CDE5_9HYPO|nr:dihydroxyacetone kinase [Trichoderma guizhouense]
MSSKHFVNDPTKLVNDALFGITLANPAVALDADNKTIYRRPNLNGSSQVSLLSGGGSGHEPSFAAFVGTGLLSAAVAGTIFASPNTEQVRKAIMGLVDSARGVLVIVMNYTGDVLNFGVAVEQAKSAGLNVEMLVVADDVGVGRQKAGKVGRRGIAGTVLVQKIAGALAAQGADLAEVHRIGRLAADNLVSVGASLEHVHVPGHAAHGDDGLQVGEVELGMGIHNEPGSGRRTADLPELVTAMLAQLLDENDKDRAFLSIKSSDEVVLLVNNLGGVSVLEMGAITTEVVTQLKAHYDFARISGSTLIQLLDAPSEATGWSAPISTQTWEAKIQSTREYKEAPVRTVQATGLKLNPVAAKSALVRALERVVASEPEITKYDEVVGDGDCGIGLKRGAEAILTFLSTRDFSGDAVVDVAEIVPLVEKTMDGTSGALYAIFLNALVRSLAASPPGEATPQVWAKALEQSSAAMSKYTSARPGDRTLVDALYPFIETLGKTGDVKEAAQAASIGAEKTKGMKASLGRTVYVGGTGFQECPDPGAWGLRSFFLALAGI